MMKIKFIILMFVMTIASIVVAKPYTQEIEIVPYTYKGEISGRIESIDYDSSIISVMVYTTENLESYKMEDFYVRHEAAIEKNDQHAELTDLKPLVNVTIRYKIDAEGRKVVEHIWIKE